MIIAGLFAAAIILFSQSLYQQAQLAQKKNAEHKKSASETTVVIAAPADAVTTNSVVNLEDKITPEPLPTFTIQQQESILKVDTRVFVRYFKILF